MSELFQWRSLFIYSIHRTELYCILNLRPAKTEMDGRLSSLWHAGHPPRKWNREAVTDTSRSATAMLWYRLALGTNGKIQKYNTAWAMLLNLKKVKINEKCYEYTIIALTDVPIRQMYLLSKLIWSTNTYKGQIESVLKGWLCWVPVSGSVARTTTTDVPIPAVSLSPRRLYCDWVKTGDSSFTSSTYTITYRHKLTITVWFTTHTYCYTHMLFSTCL